jgi:UDP-glucose 4-epimerase
MTISLVTGGAGFIGSHLARALLERGDTVRVLDNFSSGSADNLAGLPVDVRAGDIRDPQACAEAVRGVDFLYHQAAFVSVAQSMVEPQACFAVNVQGTQTLFEAARQAGVSHATVASSAAVYGESEQIPLTEDIPTQSLSPYAASKRMDEILADVYTRAFNLPVTVLRYFNVFGPRQRPDSDYAAAIPIFVRRLLTGQAVTIYGDGGQTRDLIYVGDVVRANLIATQTPHSAGRAFNICTGSETRIVDLLEILMSHFPSAPAPKFSEPRLGDIYRSVGDPSLAAQVFNFRAQISLADGLQETVAWMRQS